MPNKWTFNVIPIRNFVNQYMPVDGKGWLDPFCGHVSWAEHRNDLNPENKNAQYHLEAQAFLEQMKGKFNGAIFDPPYSLTQVSRSYNDIGLQFKSKENPTGGFPRVRDLISQKLRKGGICLSFGWNSNGIGKTRGFELIEILVVSHGGNRNDTICIAEKKVQINPSEVRDE